MTTGDDPQAGRHTSRSQAQHAGSTGLTVIGFWRDTAEPYWPDVNDYLDQTWDPEARATVADRLRAGKEVRQFRGHSTCRICGRLNGTAELTDGTYLWPEGLAHYVSDHQVRLPQPCETHFLAPRGPEGDAEAVMAANGPVGDADETWWLSLGSATWT